MDAHNTERLVRLATAFDDASDDEPETFTLPEDLSALDDGDLDALRQQAVDAFDRLYEGAEAPSDSDVETMQALADAADAIAGEQNRRAEERARNAEAAAELANRVHGSEDDADAEGDDGEEPVEATAETTAEQPAEEPAEATAEPAPEPVAASSRRPAPRSISVPSVRSRQRASAPRDTGDDTGRGRATLVAGGDLPAPTGGSDSASLRDIADGLLRRAAGGGHRPRSLSVLSIRREYPEGLTASDSTSADDVLARAANERTLPGGSLVASGGWCAPSETMYDLMQLEGSDGLIDLPEIGVERGGIQHSPGPDFASLFSDEGFLFDEDAAIDGNYDGDNGDKPVQRIDCPPFSDDRLKVAGVNIVAGILQNRAFPELTERVLAGSLIAHEHRIAGQIITDMQGEATSVTMPSDQVGAAAPLLTGIGLQAEHYRSKHRMPRDATIEVVLPYWAREMIRSDLSRRMGVDLVNVTDAAIDEWMTTRGVSPQFVYNYQDPSTTDSGAFTAWPSEVKALMYAAGTFVRGNADLVTLEAVFDSERFGSNDYTALFSEEGFLVAKRGHDAREITVPTCASGATGAPTDIDCDGTAVEEA